MNSLLEVGFKGLNYFNDIMLLPLHGVNPCEALCTWFMLANFSENVWLFAEFLSILIFVILPFIMKK